MLSLPGGPDDDYARQQKFNAIAQAMPGFGNKSVEIRFGSATATWTAAVRSAATTIAHGLGRAPVAAVVTAFATTDLTYSVMTGDATNITVQGYYLPNVNLSGTFTFTWVAYG